MSRISIIREFIDSVKHEDGPTTKKGSKRGNSLRKFHYKRKSAPKPVSESIPSRFAVGDTAKVNHPLWFGSKTVKIVKIDGPKALVSRVGEDEKKYGKPTIEPCMLIFLDPV